MNGKGKADPVDVEIGQRLRSRRLSCGMNQTDLARRLGVTFQQVQKYEKGANRISGSTIGRACAALEVDANYFFGQPGDTPQELPATMPRGGYELMRIFGALDEHRQRALLNTAKAMSPEQLAAA